MASKAQTEHERTRQKLKLQETILLEEIAKRKKAAATVSSEQDEASERVIVPDDFDPNRLMREAGDDEIPF